MSTTQQGLPSSAGSSAPQNAQAGTMVFVGGISWKATEDDLLDCFGKYGEVVEVKIIRDKYNNNQSKGYGFVLFKDSATADKVKREGYIPLLGKTMNVGDAYRGGTRGGSKNPYYSVQPAYSSTTQTEASTASSSPYSQTYATQAGTYQYYPQYSYQQQSYVPYGTSGAQQYQQYPQYYYGDNRGYYSYPGYVAYMVPGQIGSQQQQGGAASTDVATQVPQQQQGGQQ